MKKLILISNDHLKLDSKSVSSNFNDTINIIQGLTKIIFYIFFVDKNKKGIYNLFKIKNFRYPFIRFKR